MSIWSKLASVATKFLPIPGAGLIGDVIGGAGDALGAASQAAASNRGAKVDVALTEEQLNQQRKRDFINALIAREQEGRESGKSAFRESQYADYVANGGNEYKPRIGLPSYGFGPRASSEQQQASA
jgi:hypothetical protein